MKADGAAEVRGAEVMNETEADGAADMTALADGAADKTALAD